MVDTIYSLYFVSPFMSFCNLTAIFIIRAQGEVELRHFILTFISWKTHDFGKWFLFLIINGTYYLDVDERAGCCTLLDFLISCGCSCSVALTHSAAGRSEVCDYGIS